MKRTTGHSQRRKAPTIPRPFAPKPGKASAKKMSRPKPQPAKPKAAPARAGAKPKKPAAIVVTPQLRARALRVLDGLKEAYPDAHCELDFTNALEALVASILAAQSTDARVNMVTPSLFKKYRTPQDYLDTPEDTLKKEIHSTGFFNNKTKAIRNASRAIIEKFGGQMPRTMDELVSLPGVGRKTANVIIGNVYKMPGIVVDTHMLRIARRLGFTVETVPGRPRARTCQSASRRTVSGSSHARHRAREQPPYAGVRIATRGELDWIMTTEPWGCWFVRRNHGAEDLDIPT
jgi:endonuclease-3